MDRSRVTFAAALVAHVAVFVLLPRSHNETTNETHDAWMSVDLEPSSTMGSKAGTGTPTRVESSSARGLRHANHIDARPTSSELTPTQSTELSTTSSMSLPSTPFVDHGSIGLEGVGAYRFDAIKKQPESIEPTESERIADNVNHAIMDPIRAHEARNGTLADGPIVNELEKTTRQLAAAPFEGHAVIAFRIDELGLVVSASVEDASGDRRDWEEVARATFNALAQKRIHIPAGSKGIAMRVEISARVVLPSGARHAVSSPIVDALGNVANGQLNQAVDTPALAAFDLSDIGAHATRVAAAHVLSESAL